MAREGNDGRQVNPKIDLTFAKCLRSIVRQAPERHWQELPLSEIVLRGAGM